MTASVQDQLAQDRIDKLLLRVTALETKLAQLKAGQFTAGTLGNIPFLATLTEMGGAAWYPMTSNTASADGAAAWQVLNALLVQLQNNGYHE